jgi:twinkle protein
MADINEIKRRLAQSAQAVAEMLLPAGRKEGAEWRAGSAAGDKGHSLGVHLTGQKAGVWADFQSGETGDLLDLWCATKGISLPEALDAARAWLGITRPEAYRDTTPSYTRPPKPVCTAPKDRVRDYLTVDRNLPAVVLEQYKIGGRGDDIIFPFLLPDGTLAMAKARAAEDGAKPVPTASNCEPVLFGWQAIPPDAREVIITEGEIDAMSWAAYGHPAMSVPYGGGGGQKQRWIENDFDRMDRFEKIYVSTDMDGPGHEAAQEICRRLGAHRCYRVELPLKDANACLVEGHTQEQMDGCLAAAKSLDPEGLRRAADYFAEVDELFWPEPGQHVGYSVPYDKAADKIAFRPGEVTLWTGASGAGKSQILSDCAVHWVHEGSRICLSSLEMKPSHTLKRMVKQVTNIDRPTHEGISRALTFLDQGLLLYDRVGKTGIEGLLEVFDYARAKYGCDQFIIDSLMRLGVAGDDYTGQEKLVFKLVDWTIKNNVHTHMVAHARKGEAGATVPQTEDIKGAMEIGANAFNIISIWRNRRHEEDLRIAEEGSAEWLNLSEKPGVVMNIAKQRNGDFEGKVGLWFNQSTYRYASSHDRSVFARRVYPFHEHQHQEAATWP